ncbi:MAG TPA: recombination protein O N-terminal domain-containing protein [Candidatus Paceibacterota bacterium]|nr:recombination protein O N-terminal domain-containing protein [Candidatus Paceibacterota bacterium]
MYQKYHTEALVLGSREHGEADKVFALYTRDFGLVRARASAVRNEKSKMRYALQRSSRAHVSLVRGKRGWRVAGATAVKSASGDLRGVSTFARISELVLRLVHGEERNEYLFAALAEAHDALMQERCDAWATIEIVCVARVLFALGYISSEALSTALFTHTAYTGESLLEAETMKDKLLTSINKAIAETQL